MKLIADVMTNDYQLSDDVREKIEAEAKKYPSRRAALKSALRYAQQELSLIHISEPTRPY